MAKKLWAGLDIGVEKTSVCVIDDAGEVIHEADCLTNLKSVHREIAFIKRRRHATVGLEAGTGIHLARGLRNLGYSVEIYEARQLSKFLRLRRNKTDAGDANGIAQAGRLAAPLISRVHLKSLECQSLSCRLRIRRYLIGVRTGALSLLCRQLELFGGRVRSRARSASLHGEVDAQIRALFGKSSTPIVTELRQLLKYCESLMAQQDELDKELKALALENDVCRRLMDIPGVGPICALTFYAAISEPHRFRSSADVGPYLGLTPKLHQSGLTHRFGRISRMGNRQARALLIQASIRFMKCAGPDLALHAWASGVEQRRGRGKSRVALARKLATVMLAIWKSGENYRPKLVEAS